MRGSIIIEERETKMGSLYIGNNLDVLREEKEERPEYYDISFGTYNYKKAKKEGNKAKQETLKGF